MQTGLPFENSQYMCRSLRSQLSVDDLSIRGLGNEAGQAQDFEIKDPKVELRTDSAKIFRPTSP